MAYRIGIAQGYAVRDGAVACDEAVRNAGPTMIAVGRVATGVRVGGVGLEAACAVTCVRRGVEGVKASTTKTARGMEAATVKTASGTKATATVETAAAANMETTTSATAETAPTATVETTATATMKTTATAMARLGYVCEREPRDCAHQDPSERQRNLFAAPSSQHIFLHLN
jgi:hypothetical protein